MQCLLRQRQALEAIPFVAGAHFVLRAEGVHLRGRHQPGMVVLVAGHRQAEALHRVADEADRPVVGDAAEGLEQRRQVVAAEIVHQPRQFVVAPAFDQPRDVTLIADLVEQPLAPCSAPLKHQRGIKRVRAGIDPGAQLVAARLAERFFLQRAVFDDHHLPAEILEQLLVALPQAFAHHRVEALAVVVDDPPAIAQVLLPAVQQRLEDIALVELGIADERDHAAFRLVLGHTMRAHIVLHDRREQRLCDAEAHRAGGEIDIVDILGSRRIALRTLIAAEVLELFAGLLAEQILDSVKDRRCMRLDRDAILRTQDVEIKCGHDGRERGRRSLMSADLQPVDAVTQMIGIVDGPARQPQHLLFQFGQDVDAGRLHAALPQNALPGGAIRVE